MPKPVWGTLVAIFLLGVCPRSGHSQGPQADFPRLTLTATGSVAPRFEAGGFIAVRLTRSVGIAGSVQGWSSGPVYVTREWVYDGFSLGIGPRFSSGSPQLLFFAQPEVGQYHYEDDASGIYLGFRSGLSWFVHPVLSIDALLHFVRTPSSEFQEDGVSPPATLAKEPQSLVAAQLGFSVHFR